MSSHTGRPCGLSPLMALTQSSAQEVHLKTLPFTGEKEEAWPARMSPTVARQQDPG